MAVVFTRVSDNRVKVDIDGHLFGLSLGGTNVFEHPSKDEIILTRNSEPSQCLNGRNDALIIKAEDVTTPANTGKTNLVDLLITTIFN